jgi:uncharacterized protein DUF3592
VTLQFYVGMAFAAFGMSVLLWTAFSSYEAIRSTQWPSTSGTVSASVVEETKDLEGDVLHRARISYVYSVAGREFVGSRARFGNWLFISWRWVARRLMRRYPIGSAVRVHYDPSDPADSVLEPGVSWFLLDTLIFGLAFLAFGLFTASTA